MEGFLNLTTLNEHSGDIPSATGMVCQLIEDHEQIVRNLREHVDRCTDEFHDQGTADFLTELMEEHEEMAWMLRSFVEGEELQPDRTKPQIEEGKTPVGV
jgi:starvation-inducible DNA-binding protein